MNPALTFFRTMDVSLGARMRAGILAVVFPMLLVPDDHCGGNISLLPALFLSPWDKISEELCVHTK